MSALTLRCFILLQRVSEMSEFISVSSKVIIDDFHS